MKYNNTYLYLTAVIFVLHFSLYGQKMDSVSVQKYKNLLPYVLKSIKTNPKPKDKLYGKTIGEFKKPWKAKRTKQYLIESIFKQIKDSSNYQISKDMKGNKLLISHSYIKLDPEILKLSNSENPFENLFVEISEIEITDNENKKLHVKNLNKLNFPFEGNQLMIMIPVTEITENFTANFKLEIKEYTNLEFKKFNRLQSETRFDFDGKRGIKFLKIEKNRAYFTIPTLMENIEVIGTNIENETFISNSKIILPKIVYDYDKENNVSDEEMNNFVSKLSLRKIYNNPQMLMLVTNGELENVYIHSKSKPITRKKSKIELKHPK